MDELASNRSAPTATSVADVVVVTGSSPLSGRALAALPAGAVVIAADGALDRAIDAGLEPDGVVGDLDSISADGLEWARRHATIDRHEPDKDRTDTELALALAVDLNPDRLILLGAGSRLDHTLGAIGALGHPTLTSVPTLEAWWDDQHLFVVHGPGKLGLDLAVGTTISLLAMHGLCTGVGIDGVRWPLLASALAPMVGHGISNVTVTEHVSVAVSTGVLTVLIVERGAE
jgi:thiamine pyrophosphokinase